MATIDKSANALEGTHTVVVGGVSTMITVSWLEGYGWGWMATFGDPQCVLDNQLYFTRSDTAFQACLTVLGCKFV